VGKPFKQTLGRIGEKKENSPKRDDPLAKLKKMRQGERRNGKHQENIT